MSPRRSIALMVLRLADRGRISSLSFNRRRTGLPPSESVFNWYPSWMCETRSCSVSVSFGGSLAVFFFAILHADLRRSSSQFPPVGLREIEVGNTRRNAATTGTKGYAPAFHRASDWQPRGRLRSAVGRRVLQTCAPTTGFRQWSARHPSVTISNISTAMVKREIPWGESSVFRLRGTTNWSLKWMILTEQSGSSRMRCEAAISKRLSNQITY